MAGSEIQELPKKKKKETEYTSPSILMSGKGAILKFEIPSRQESDSLSALGHNCSDRFISSQVPAMSCETWAFVSRGKAAAFTVRYFIRKPQSRDFWRSSHRANPSQDILFYLYSPSTKPLISNLPKHLQRLSFLLAAVLWLARKCMNRP